MIRLFATVLLALSLPSLLRAEIIGVKVMLSEKGVVNMVVNARMDFEAPQRLAAFCAD